MESERHFQLYLEECQRWMTPKEISDLRRKLGSIEDILERHESLEQLLRDAEKRRTVWAFLRAAALAFVAVVGFLATLKAVIPIDWYTG
jgi:hypothetical protein